jgi:hypothetical protein
MLWGNLPVQITTDQRYIFGRQHCASAQIMLSTPRPEFKYHAIEQIFEDIRLAYCNQKVENNQIYWTHAYLPLLFFSTPCETRTASDLEIWRNEDRYSLKISPFNAKDILAGTMDWTTSNRDALFSLYYTHAQKL